MDFSECARFDNRAIMGSHAVRSGKIHGRGGVNRGNRVVGLAVSGQTLEGLRRDPRNLPRQNCGALLFIGANDVLAMTTAVMNRRISVDQASDTIRAQTMNLLKPVSYTHLTLPTNREV